MSDFFMIMGYIFLFVLVGSLVCLLFIKVLCVLLRGPIANEVTIRAGARFKKTGMPRVVKALEEADEQKRVLSFPLVLLDTILLISVVRTRQELFVFSVMPSLSRRFCLNDSY